jgi:prolyl-tRNA editing enzyme YbaK/EbsC (Cys-tRNA(Pro) deacylase)
MQEPTLDPAVIDTLNTYGLSFKVFPCDPELADTAAFCEHYGFSPDQSANTIVVTSRKVEPVRRAACVVLATTKLDVNKKVSELLDAKRVSFADSETTMAVTGMMIGGVTAVGISDLPVYVDAAVMQRDEIILGGGNRSTKLLIHPHELTKLPNVQIVEGLGIPKTA